MNYSFPLTKAVASRFALLDAQSLRNEAEWGSDESVRIGTCDFCESPGQLLIDDPQHASYCEDQQGCRARCAEFAS